MKRDRREYYIKHKEQILKQSREYYKKNRNKIKSKVKEYSKKPEVRARKKEYQKEYYNKNKEKLDDYKRKYYKRYNKERYHKKLKNDPEFKLKTKKYYQKNKNNLEWKEKIKIRRRIYRMNNKEKIKASNQKYREKNKEAMAEYYQRNKEKRKIKDKIYFQKNRNKIYNRIKTKKKNDKGFKISCNLRKQLWTILNRYTKTGKIMSSNKYGINYKAIIEHLKPLPENLNNYEVHHIKPLYTFNFINKDGSTNLKEIKEAFSPKNHKLLTIEEHKKINHMKFK